MTFWKDAPAVHVQEKTKYGSINESIELSCHVASNPSSIINWYHETERVNVTRFNETVKIFELGYQEFGYSVSSKLTVFIDSKEVFGNYICHAYNNIGIKRKIITLVEKSKCDFGY